MLVILHDKEIGPPHLDKQIANKSTSTPQCVESYEPKTLGLRRWLLLITTQDETILFQL